MPHIKVIQHQEAEGRLKEIYDDLIEKRGQLAEVHKIQSLRPESIVKHIDLYMEIMFSKSLLSRAQREMMAVVVSLSNGCEYCATHHGAALNAYWKDEQRLTEFKKDFYKVNLSPTEIALCEYAQKVTENPAQATQTDLTLALKNQNLADEAILDATLVVAYFNFVNRIVLSLGVDLETDSGENYKY